MAQFSWGNREQAGEAQFDNNEIIWSKLWMPQKGLLFQVNRKVKMDRQSYPWRFFLPYISYLSSFPTCRQSLCFSSSHVCIWHFVVFHIVSFTSHCCVSDLFSLDATRVFWRLYLLPQLFRICLPLLHYSWFWPSPAKQPVSFCFLFIKTLHWDCSACGICFLDQKTLSLYFWHRQTLTGTWIQMENGWSFFGLEEKVCEC